MAEATQESCSLPRVSRLDLIVSGSVLILALVPILVRANSAMLAMHPRWFLITAECVGAALLVGRRRHPWATWCATTSVGLAAVAAGGGPTTAYVPAVVALFAVSLRVPTVRAVLAALVSAFAPVVLIIVVGRDGAFDTLAFGMTAWSGVALMSGIAVRSQRAVVAAAHERARLAEATREEEAERRVREERFRIARELHDVLGHHVSVINVQAGVAGHLIRSDPGSAAEAMGHVREASQTVLREVAEILGLLRSGGPELETTPVPTLLDIDALIERARRSGADVEWHTQGTPYELSPTVDLTAYRIAQEALTNAARHGSGPVHMRMDYAHDAVTIEITNAQAGGPTADGLEVGGSAEGGSAVGGHGLAGMRERAAAVDGAFTAGPDGSGGWVVRARLPVDRRHTHPLPGPVSAPLPLPLPLPVTAPVSQR